MPARFPLFDMPPVPPRHLHSRFHDPAALQPGAAGALGKRVPTTPQPQPQHPEMLTRASPGRKSAGAAWQVQPVAGSPGSPKSGSLQEWQIQHRASPTGGSTGLKSPRILYSSPLGGKTTPAKERVSGGSGTPSLKGLGVSQPHPSLNLLSSAPLAHGSPRASLREPQHPPVEGTPHSLLASKRQARSGAAGTRSPSKDDIRPRTPTNVKPLASPRTEIYADIDAVV